MSLVMTEAKKRLGQHKSASVVLKQGLSTSDLPALGQKVPCGGGGHAMHYKVVLSFPVLHLLEACSKQPSLPSCDNQEMSTDIAECPLGYQIILI